MYGEKYNPACGDIMQLLVHGALSFWIEFCIDTNYYFYEVRNLGGNSKSMVTSKFKCINNLIYY